MNLRRLITLALFVAALMAPSAAFAAGVVGLGMVLGLAPRLRAARRSRAAPVSEGVTLGVDSRRRTVVLSDAQLAAHALILGASGAGKSTTLLTVLEEQIRRDRPVIAIDMKGSPAFAQRLRAAAADAGRELTIWTPEGPSQWNPLAYGNPTALKDKLISSERFSEPHYQRAAERYLQSAIEVLRAVHPQRAVRLDEVVSAMEPGRLRGMLRAAPPSLGERVQDYLGGLTGDQLSAIRGIGTRLALLSESTAGPYLLPTRPAGAARELDLRAALEGGDVVLFSLNASIYGKLAAQLGALAVQDLVSATGYRLEGDRQQRPATVGIDEFSALGADNLLALLARGRESGVSVLLATQELSDLERAAPGFRDQVLGITGIKIAHRQEVPASASTISQMAGTERVWERTEPVAGLLTDPGRTRATRRQVERFIVHPNEIKTLPVGHAVMLSRLPRSEVVRALVVPPRSAATRGGRTGGGREGGAREL